MKNWFSFIAAALVAASVSAVQIEVTNPIALARPRETIEVKLRATGPWVVRDAAGAELVAQQLADGGLIFQSDFAPQEIKRFTVTAGTPALADSKVFGRFVPERLITALKAKRP